MSAMEAPLSLAEVRKQRKQDSRALIDDLRMELETARTEAIRLVIDCQPHLARLEMVAHEIGPVALQSVIAIRALIGRNADRRDAPDDDGAAA